VIILQLLLYRRIQFIITKPDISIEGFIRDALQDGEIDLLYCKTEEQLADIFTKPLARDRFEYLRKALGVISAQHLEGSVGL